jgi:hypothetical protein
LAPPRASWVVWWRRGAWRARRRAWPGAPRARYIDRARIESAEKYVFRKSNLGGSLHPRTKFSTRRMGRAPARAASFGPALIYTVCLYFLQMIEDCDGA